MLGRKRLIMLFDMNRRQRPKNSVDILDRERLCAGYGFQKAKLWVYNHHAAHGAPAYFFSEFDDALIYTADGIGDNISYSASIGRNGIEILSGGDGRLLGRYQVNSIGFLYGYFTKALGFMWNRHEGKLTGLAGYGRPVAADEITGAFHGRCRGRDCLGFSLVHGDDGLCRTKSHRAVARGRRGLGSGGDRGSDRTGGRGAAGADRTALARARRRRFRQCTAQSRAPGKRRDRTGFIFPAMGDDGLPVGGCLLYLLDRDGAAAWQRARYRLENLYLGRDHEAQFDAAAAKLPQIASCAEQPVERAVDALVAGRIVAIYTGRMEFGPRALGARSILAAATANEVNDTINARLERSEFMPLAPVVLERHASEVFDINPGNAHAARFMTITCDVRPDWRKRIPAVVHVDGSARPQTIRRRTIRSITRCLSSITGAPASRCWSIRASTSTRSRSSIPRNRR